MKKIVTFSFKESFISNLVKYLDENYLAKGKDLTKLAIVFGGKRPELFLKKELAKKIKHDFYPPRFFAIDEFVSYIVKKKFCFLNINDMDNCYLLYNLALKKTPLILKGREKFSDFLPWTREILRFIDQLDIENIDNISLRNIEDNARIGYPVPEDINKLLENIVTLRESYHDYLDKNKKFSRGYKYLTASKIVSDVGFEEFNDILFCNFFYLSKCEETILKELYLRGKAVLIFQGDERKWPILKKISRQFDTKIQENNFSDKPSFELNLYSGFDAHSQMGIAREILKKIEKKDKTVIILPEPNHIIPLISEITSLTEEFNISMGYPLKRSSLYCLLELIFKTQVSKKENKFYAKDYLKVIKHPLIKNLKINNEPVVSRVMAHKIEEILKGKEKTSVSGSLFLALEDIERTDEVYELSLEVLSGLNTCIKKENLKECLAFIHDLVFRKWDNIKNFSDFAFVLNDFLDCMIEKSFLANYPLNMNIASKMYGIKEELETSDFRGEIFQKQDIFKIFDSKISNEIVSFKGSPLKGLQILGLFEARSLNFENVIVVDINEGILPSLNIYEPLVPREVMIGLNLDRLEREEEIQRYQFLRLISSAKNVHLIYQESKDKEKSRFVEELVWEQQKVQKQFCDFPVLRPGFEVKVKNPVRRIKKTAQMVEALRKHTFSASSISTYLKNPYEFYYSYVLGLREQEDLLDEPDSRQVGTFIHELLEEAFRPYINKKMGIDKFFRDNFIRLLDKKFNDTFNQSMKSDSFLLKAVLIERLNRFLDNEEISSDRQLDRILFLEKRFDELIPLSCGGIKFAYVVDRIDLLKDKTVMIIDYKTGSVDTMPKSPDVISSLQLSRESIRDNVRSFQIPLYFHYLKNEFKGQKVNAALYNLRTLKFNKFLENNIIEDYKRINDVFLKALDFIICEILDPNVDFIEDFSNKYKY